MHGLAAAIWAANIVDVLSKAFQLWLTKLMHGLTAAL